MTLDQMTAFLVTETQCDFCIVSAVPRPGDGGSYNANVVGISALNGPAEKFEYGLSGSPCEQVTLSNTLCCYPKDVVKLFPYDQLLSNMGIVGYMGVPVFSSKKEFLGVIAVLNKKPFNRKQCITCEALLKMMISRVGFDLERQILERDCDKRSQLFASLSNEIHKLHGEALNYKVLLSKYNITPAANFDNKEATLLPMSSSSEHKS